MTCIVLLLFSFLEHRNDRFFFRIMDACVLFLQFSPLPPQERRYITLNWPYRSFVFRFTNSSCALTTLGTLFPWSEATSPKWWDELTFLQVFCATHFTAVRCTNVRWPQQAVYASHEVINHVVGMGYENMQRSHYIHTGSANICPQKSKFVLLF